MNPSITRRSSGWRRPAPRSFASIMRPFAKAAAMLYAGPWVAERLAAVGDLAERNPDAIHPVVRGILLGAKSKTALETFHAFYNLADLIRAAKREWAKMDVMLLPTAPHELHDRRDACRPCDAQYQSRRLYELREPHGSCRRSPCRRGSAPDGMPFGVTLIGPALTDGMLCSDRRRAAQHAARHAARGHAHLPVIDSACVAREPNRRRRSWSRWSARIFPASRSMGSSSSAARRSWRRRARRTAIGSTRLPAHRPPNRAWCSTAAAPAGIEVEIWEMDQAAFGSFVALVPAPLGIGTMTLADGRNVQGFICEAYATRGAEDITAFGGWRAWLAARTLTA